MKKILSLVLAMIMTFSILVIQASAARAISIKDDFAAYTDGDVSAMGLVRTFKNLDSCDHARIKYAFGKGYLCPDGGGVTASIVYKIQLENGEKFSALNLKAQAILTSREGYSKDWTDAPKGVVSVSTNGSTYKDVKEWKGELVAKSLGQNDYSTLSPKTYTADLLSAAGSAAELYIKISWDVYDYPLYSSIHSIDISGQTTGGNGKIDTATTTKKATTQNNTTKKETTAKTQDNTTAVEATDPADAIDSTDSSEIAGDVTTNSQSSSAANTDTDADTDTDDGKDGGFPVGVIIAIIIIFTLAAAGGIVFLVYKKGVFKNV